MGRTYKECPFDILQTGTEPERMLYELIVQPNNGDQFQKLHYSVKRLLDSRTPDTLFIDLFTDRSKAQYACLLLNSLDYEELELMETKYGEVLIAPSYME